MVIGRHSGGHSGKQDETTMDTRAGQAEPKTAVSCTSRPSACVNMPNGSKVFTLDVGYNFTRYALVANGSLLLSSAISTPVDSAEAFYDAVARIAEQAYARMPYDGIAISMPGFVDVRRNMAVTGGPIAALHHQPIAKEIASRLGFDVPIRMENDANCAALAERYAGNAQKVDDFALITDTGVGGSLFLDGRIRHGREWRAGEIGMMITNYEAAGCRTLHDYISTESLSRRYAEEFGVAAETVVPSSLLRRLGDPGVRGVVEEWGRYVAACIFNVIATVDPECILVGGTLGQELAFLPLIQNLLEAHPEWKYFRTPVKRCRHTANAGLLGAYYAFVTAQQAP